MSRMVGPYPIVLQLTSRARVTEICCRSSTLVGSFMTLVLFQCVTCNLFRRCRDNLLTTAIFAGVPCSGGRSKQSTEEKRSTTTSSTRSWRPIHLFLVRIPSRQSLHFSDLALLDVVSLQGGGTPFYSLGRSLSCSSLLAKVVRPLNFSLVFSRFPTRSIPIICSALHADLRPLLR